jgi:hypothetical protein
MICSILAQSLRQCCGSGSRPFDAGPEATKIDLFVPFVVLKSVMNTQKYTFANFYFINECNLYAKNFVLEKFVQKILWARIRIRNRTWPIWKVGSESGQKSSGSATLDYSCASARCFVVSNHRKISLIEALNHFIVTC